MAVLVTGGAGYIGSHVALALIQSGKTVVILDDLRSGFRELAPPTAIFVEGDVGGRAVVDNLFREHQIEAVIHLAASTVVSESVASPLDYYGNNTAPALLLLQACVDHGVGKFIFSSTAAVYGVTGSKPVAEDWPLQPASPYGASKMMVERMIQDASAAHGLGAVILRYFNVAGADPGGRSGQRTRGATNLIKVACEVAAGNREELVIFGDDYPTSDGTCVRDYIHVSDLAAAHLQALDHPLKMGGAAVFNVGYGRGASVREVIDAVEAECGRAIPVRMAGRRPGDVPFAVADSQRLRALLGWLPAYSDLRFIVRTALAYERSLKSPSALPIAGQL